MPMNKYYPRPRHTTKNVVKHKSCSKDTLGGSLVEKLGQPEVSRRKSATSVVATRVFVQTRTMQTKLGVFVLKPLTCWDAVLDVSESFFASMPLQLFDGF